MCLEDRTCVLLHPPGFELYDGVGIMAGVLSLAAVPDGFVAQIQLAQDAQWTDLSVVHIVGPHHKCQAPDGHREKNQRVFKID